MTATLEQVYFNAMRDGVKTLEVRPAERFGGKNWKVGDVVTFQEKGGDATFKAQILRKTEYDALGDDPSLTDALRRMASSEDYVKLIPSAESVDDVIAAYLAIYGQTARQILAMVVYEVKVLA